MSDAEKYCKDVLSGKIVAGHYIHLACQRFLNWLKDPEIEFREKEAKEVIDWFESRLYNWEGEWQGKPFKLELWQKFLIQQIFGLYKDGLRMINKAYVQVARKNGKTTLLGGITLYHLFKDSENSPVVMIGANNEDQAKICASTAGNIIDYSPVLSQNEKAGNIIVYRNRGSVNRILFPEKKGVLMPISRDVKTKDGYNPSLAAVDEYHEADTSELLDVMRSGQGARLNPLLIVITTAGFKKDKPCYSQLRRVGVDILLGLKEDDSQLALIYEPDEEDNWQDENTWLKANPNYNVSVFPKYMKTRLQEAINEGAQKEVEFRTKNLNTWTNASTVWIKDEIWTNGKEEPRKDLEYYTGLDMAYKRDWTAWVLIGKDEDNFFHVIPYFWIPEETVQDKYKNENSQLLDWIDKGLVFTTYGNVTDHDAVSSFILGKREEFRIKNCIADPAYCISVINQLNQAGLETMELPQTPSRLTQPTTFLYELAMQGRIKHGNNPVLRWMMSNAVIKEYGSDLIKITKERENGKIDGIDAMINAFVPHVLEEQEGNSFFMEIW